MFTISEIWIDYRIYLLYFIYKNIENIFFFAFPLI